jgi:alkylation response protein AidB-like acyl-CoA dehydrogenase
MKRIFGCRGDRGGARCERLWRDSRILAIVGGANEEMLDEAAKRY